MSRYDHPCSRRGFSLTRQLTASFNPLCEHAPGQRAPYTPRVEGADQAWVTVAGQRFKWIKIPYGVTRDEAEQICRGSGGRLATISSEDTRLRLQDEA